MPVVRTIGRLVLPCVVFLVGCPNDPALCPEATIEPGAVEIPDGESSTTIRVDVDNPSPENGLDIVTELTADNGTFADPFAAETTFRCPFDLSGQVEVCVNAKYVNPLEEEDDAASTGGVSSTSAAIREPHVRFNDPIQCSETRCTNVVCPEEKNECPTISDFAVEPSELEEGQTATVRVVANDPDANPETLSTTFSANFGSFDDPNASEATYTCDDEVGGIIEICVVASDGDSACDLQQCTTVLCPGTPAENTCPSIASFTADPITIEPGDFTAEITVDVTDPDRFPSPLRTELSSDTGVFDDRFVTETTFFCGEPGPVEMCVEASDGDETCDQERCITVQCPSDIPANVCPMLFVLNAIPSTIPPGQTTTRVESRAQDTDALPVPLSLSMRALWGTISDDENIFLPGNVVAQDAMYTCDRPGDAEICVDATDGACVKTLCIEVSCPDDIPPP